ncbi:hypothetical protein SAMN05216344_11293 [Polaromonas sp. OV174]|uniref:DUF2726 domain-containing protein n=1 Tax=Polaromonas sp. OV174 TaxID=1855300 RepID=UPI0008F3A461|nr:DUF2726 domain-containing protein [Polaromonas sp. OV174]SFC25711.1 hypothetical protein SAMN05216344_11293 [Polaromonas sp. OV174]
MSSYSNGLGLTLGGIALLMGAGLGALVHAWWLRRTARMRRRIPKHWPLRQRLVASNEERKVWRWLSLAFPDHSVMVKMPVTRFTLPITKDLGLHWFELLSVLYCTFTITTTADGRVIGCVDVAGQRRLPSKNRILKETLLNQCGIAYIVMDAADLPSLDDMRREFLGDMAFVPQDRENERNQAAIISASTSLRESLTRQRKTRDSGQTPNGDDHHDSLDPNDSSSFPTLWQHNSFIMPLDSRKSELH